ncbi:hypothetical protein [Paraburkholderia hospita]|uniref:hypothetical protein n=1 Tax=Paraburkholderia hospita TaxID=169430 RepID=UPI000DEF9B2F|nr:hypothetical protein [Paraburkholderia hospita]AXE97734.1 hypothetical protein CUJ88_04010 [Paraburkholderia hospita]
MTRYRYEVEPRAEAYGGGYQLRLFDGDTEMGGGVFPADRHKEPYKGVAWFNSLPERERARWLKEAGSARPIDAWGAYLQMLALDEAKSEGELWLASR